ncbi:MAG TPA: ParB/RepB/Spo0J family partition protein [Acidobacteriota bacterium]|nr:ParB/RepB/Spo0J family partition protein [Acidobacteriota bacterium]
MKTKTAPVADAPAPAVLTPPSEPALNLFTFDEHGACTNPETFAVKVPKGANCAILLACDPDSAKWSWGLALSAGADIAIASPVMRTGEPHETRESALLAGLKAAEQFFAASPKNKLARKCGGEVTAQLIALGSLPANTKAQTKIDLGAQLPEPKDADLPLAELEENPANPREQISEADVAELAESMKIGLLQPVGVRVIVTGDGLPGAGTVRKELMWGHRRRKAALLLGWEKIRCRVYENISDAQARLLMSIENLQRKDLDPIQEARGYADMMRDFDLTQDDIARQVKKSRPVVANALRLLDLPPDVQQLLSDGKLTIAHGTALASYKDFPEVCSFIAKHAVDEHVSAGEIEDHLLCEEGLRGRQFIFRCPADYEPAKAEAWRFRKAWVAIGWYCLDAGFWEAEVKRLSEEKKAERKKQKEREAKAEKTTVAAKKELTPEDGAVVGDSDRYLLDLVPEDKIANGKNYHGQKCTLVLDKSLWELLCTARQEILNEDAQAKAAPLIAAGWARASAIKKLEGDVLVAIKFARLDIGTFDGPVAQRLGLSIAKHEKACFVKERFSYGSPTIVINELKNVDPLALAKLHYGLIVEHAEQKVAEGNARGVEPWLRFFGGAKAVPFLDEAKAKDRAEICRRVKERMQPKPALESESANQSPRKATGSKGGKKK